MRLSPQSISDLASIVLDSPYRTGPELIEFFGCFGIRDLYGPNFGSRNSYTRGKLSEFNGRPEMERIVCHAFDRFSQKDLDAEAAASLFNKTLMRDGYALTIETEAGFNTENGYVGGLEVFRVLSRQSAIPEPEALTTLKHESVAEQIAKCKKRIADGDFAGAIASSYTLVEEFLKLVLRNANVEVSAQQGDIRDLYKLLRSELGLDPSEKAMDPTLKPILEGLQRIVSGLYDLSNRASDRHARVYNPAKRHAKLAVNAAFSLCEFLLDVEDAQRERK